MTNFLIDNSIILFFSSEHFTYANHSCSAVHQKDVQVPVCPLCDEPIPTDRDTSPDVTVGQHIDEHCLVRKTKIFTNKCTFGTCKKKELIPFACSVCQSNFCLAHRHTIDHKCQGPPKQQPRREQQSAAAQAALARQSRQTTISNFFNRQTTSNHAQSVQGNMSEDEALAHALALSMQQEENQSRTQQQQQPVPCGGGSKDRCLLS